jgi:shikimate dehydrogenase
VERTADSRLLVVLGDPVGHSVSPAMQNAAIRALGLDAVYVALRLPTTQFATAFPALTTLGVAGNVTVPHKAAAYRAVGTLTDVARASGAVNTFWSDDGAIHGDNTDVAGVAEALDDLGAPPPWLVLGTGGSARAVALAAAGRGAALVVRSREPARAVAFAAWAREAGADAAPDDGRAVGTIVNATPLGLAPGDPAPLAAERTADADAVLDLVYAPGETDWVRAARAGGCRAADGRGMLVAQGAHAFERFFPAEAAPREIMRAAVARALLP